MNRALDRSFCASFRRSGRCALAIAAAFFCSATCSASFIVLSGNHPAPPVQLVQFDTDVVGLTIEGTTNQTGAEVVFESSSQFLATQGATILQAVENGDVNADPVPIDDAITISLADPELWFTGLIFNAFMGGTAGGSLNVAVSGFDQLGDPITQTIALDSDGDPLSLGHGANFFTVLAENGQRITSVEIAPTPGTAYVDLRQIRISNLIPEPGSAALLLIGVALIHVTRRRR